MTHSPVRIKGRGAASNTEGRFEKQTREMVDDGWHQEDESPSRCQTSVTEERARHIISRHDSPDLPFEQSINPYRGCEHGCPYCYARPSHSYLNLSPGLDFETRLFAKTNAADLLQQELAKPSYRCSVINLGANTDPYQPIERRYSITRSIIQVLAVCKHPLTIITKNALVERDIDLLAPMATQQLVQVFISITSLDNQLSSRLEPRASAPHRRLETIHRLTSAGIPCGVMVAPIIPAITDQYLEQILEATSEAGATTAAYTLLRLPWEVKDIFREWLHLHFPERATHVISLIQQLHGGRDNDPRFGQRMHGQGIFADLIRQRFKVAYRRYGFLSDHIKLTTELFIPPKFPSAQGELF